MQFSEVRRVGSYVVCDKSLKVKPKLHLRPQDVGNASNVECLPRRPEDTCFSYFAHICNKIPD